MRKDRNSCLNDNKPVRLKSSVKAVKLAGNFFGVKQVLIEYWL